MINVYTFFTLALVFLCLSLNSISPTAAFTAPQPVSSVRLAHHALYAADNDDATSSSTKERKPWEFLRFVNQSSKFVTPPPLPFIGGGRRGSKRKVVQGETLWSPSSSDNFFSFAPLDDVVMGGASSSTVDNNTGIWSGTVTDANNGGFVGIRSTPFQNDMSLDMTGCKGIEIRLRKGDGQRFKCVVRDSTEFNGICWTTEFDAGKNSSIRVPFTKQIPTLFAKTVSGKTFDDENVVGFQLAYSKFQYDGELNKKFRLGDFSLQILEVKSY